MCTYSCSPPYALAIAFSRRQHYVPKPEDVPEALRGLSEDAIFALRPLDIEVGAEKRSKTAEGRDNGYRQKTQMTRFLYSKRSPKTKIKRIDDRAMRAKARAAYDYLVASEDSSYKKFLDMRLDFMTRTEKPTTRQRRRLPSFLEEVGLECAMWPHLYWQTEMCESYERFNDIRRVRRREHKAFRPRENDLRNDSDAGENSENSDSDEDDKASEDDLDGEVHQLA